MAKGSFKVDRRDFQRGNNSYLNHPDGGIITTGRAFNIFKKPSFLSNGPDFIQKTTSLKPIPAASFGHSTDTVVGMSIMALGIDNVTEDGYYYSVSTAGVFTLQGSGDSSQNYAHGFSDTVYYKGKFYTTSKTDIIENAMDVASGSRDLSWWITTKVQSSLNNLKPHPLLVYGDIMYIADGELVHQNDGGTVTPAVLDLNRNFTITAWLVYNGLIFMAAEPYINANGTFHGQGKILTWDGFSPSWLDEYDNDMRIDTMVVFDRVLYCFTKSYLGFFDGSGVVPIYPLNNQVFRHQVSIIDNSLVFVDGGDIIRYGTPIYGGKKVFTKFAPTANDQNDGSQYFGILGFQNRELITTQNQVAGGDPFSRLCSDINGSTTSVTNTYTFNPRTFSRPVRIRKVVIQTDGVTSTHTVLAGYINDQNASKAAGTVTSASVPSTRRFEFDVFGQDPTTIVQPYITVKGDVDVKSIEYFYDDSESPLNK